MKRILIPIDFSEAALNAMEYGIAVANHINANVRIMHVKTGLHYAPTYAKNQAEYRVNEKVDEWLVDLIKKYDDDYVVPGGKFDFKVREGNVVHEISNQAKYDDSSLIVMGSHGASGFQSKWIGSNAYSLVAHAPCPVIVLNQEMKWNGGIRKIVVPVDYTKASRKKIPVIAGIASVFKSRIFLVAVRESKLQYLLKRVAMFNRQVEKYFVTRAGVEVEKSVLVGKKPVQRLISFAEEKNADLITVHVNHTHNPFVNIFKPFANELINNSSKPVLVVPTYE
ncbi:universal stress protein [Carboxylicivirga caseinilyticus]|uniref:universal stress protein n=1 Tax=Carboxylicivirga caseinilyticus TaxID=3417572 RepID=UPI003D33B354|nr:universal stress protein [Marinilabiliaceae bacterium A049]